MADQIRRVDYFYVEVPDKPGEGVRVLSALTEAGVNLLSFTAFPVGGGKSQIDVVPQDAAALERVTLSLLAGTPALTLIGAIGAAVTVSLRRGGLLMAVLVLPLTTPVLIFGVSAAGAGAADPAPFAILCALSLAAIAGAPFAAAAALRFGGE